MGNDENTTFRNHQLKPRSIEGREEEDAWFYESPEGIEVVVERIGYEDTTTVILTWAQLRAAIKREDAKPKVTP